LWASRFKGLLLSDTVREGGNRGAPTSIRDGSKCMSSSSFPLRHSPRTAARQDLGSEAVERPIWWPGSLSPIRRPRRRTATLSIHPCPACRSPVGRSRGRGARS